MPIGTLRPFLNLPYDHNVTVSEVNSEKKATAVGYLLGTGEKFDKWDAFPLYFQKPGADGQLRSLQRGKTVNVGELWASGRFMWRSHSCSHPSWNKGGWHSGEWQDAELLLRPPSSSMEMLSNMCHCSTCGTKLHLLLCLEWALSLLMIGWMTWLAPVACQYVTNCTPQMPY